MIDNGWAITTGDDAVVATAIHAGHALRPEIAALSAIPEETRTREEDPHTDEWLWFTPNTIAVSTSRFEFDLNRSRTAAVYRQPEDAWGLELWTRPLSDAQVSRSLEKYDGFYRDLAAVCDDIAEKYPRFVLLDLHSYNHRRRGPDAAVDDPEENPEINIGTGSVDHQIWQDVIDVFAGALAAHPFDGGHLDVRENVRFRGGHMSRWLNDRYGSRGCALAIEVKKFYMDEWTGQPDEAAVVSVGEALAVAAAATREMIAG